MESARPVTASRDRPARGDAYMEWLVESVKPLVDRSFPTRRDRAGDGHDGLIAGRSDQPLRRRSVPGCLRLHRGHEPVRALAQLEDRRSSTRRGPRHDRGRASTWTWAAESGAAPSPRYAGSATSSSSTAGSRAWTSATSRIDTDAPRGFLGTPLPDALRFLLRDATAVDVWLPDRADPAAWPGNEHARSRTCFTGRMCASDSDQSACVTDSSVRDAALTSQGPDG